MRRTVFIALLLVAASAFAINTDLHPVRIGLLASSDRWADRRDTQTSDQVRTLLRNELRERGFDAFITGDRLTDVARDEHPQADFYLDVIGSDGGSHELGGIGIGGRNGGVDISVITSRVAASVVVYDGRTLEQIRTIDLQKHSTAIAPTAIALGGRSIWGVIALPIVEWSQYRAGVRSVAHDAARQVAEALAH